MMTGEELREWMQAHGYSVRKLAAALGVQPSSVQFWRTGTHKCPKLLPLALKGLLVN